MTEAASTDIFDTHIIQTPELTALRQAFTAADLDADRVTVTPDESVVVVDEDGNHVAWLANESTEDDGPYFAAAVADVGRISEGSDLPTVAAGLARHFAR